MSATDDRLMSIFSTALDCESETERSAYLVQACRNDSALAVRVQELLRAHEEAGQFLQSRPEETQTATIPSAADRPGTVIGPYKLLEQIGEGGFGVVFVAEQTRPVRRKVAVKVLKPGMDTRQVVARFEAERQALAIMDHPSIARVFDGGTTPTGRPYFVMELVKGVPITEFCDQNHLTPRQRLELFIPVCQAVQHAHQKGIIHRDLKPSNILVVMHDTTPVPKIIDFGVAKALGQELTERTLFTGYAQMVGTPLYMSPEQAGQNGLDIDTRSDIYTLGVLLYELLTGTTPFGKERFKASSYDEIRRIIRDEDPPAPSTRLSELEDTLPSISAQRQTEPAKLTKLLRGELDWIVMKALEKDRNRRYETANGFAADVKRYLTGEAVQAVPPSVGYRLRKFARRNKRALVSTALLGGMLLILAGSLGWMVSDRAARRTRTAFEVNQFLQQAESLYAANKLPEAVAAVHKARGVLGTTGGGDTDLHLRVQQRFTELETAAKLEEILAEFKEPPARDREYAEYARVFRDYGIDVEALSTEEAAARIADSNIKLDLVLALEQWASSLRFDPRPQDPARWQRLLAISRAADTDPWRLRYNAASDAKDLRALGELADGADLARLRTRVLAALGDSLRAAGDVEASVAFLRKVQRRYPADYSINASLAWSLRSLNPPQWHEAIAFRRIAVAVRPQSCIANFYLGFSLQTVGMLDEAMIYYRTAVDLDPEHAPAQFSLANVLRLRGKPDEALVHFQKAIDLRPTDPNPLNGLVWELATCAEPRLRDPARAVELAKKVVDLSLKQGDDRHERGRDWLGNYWNTLGVAHYRAGQMEEALTALQQSLDIAKSLNFAPGKESRFVCEDWFFLAMTNCTLDRKDEARKWYDRAAGWMEKKAPKDEELRRFRAEAAALMGIDEKP
jgi:eukaryotic-like serine/threonine-protein kinase